MVVHISAAAAPNHLVGSVKLMAVAALFLLATNLIVELLVVILLAVC